MAFSYAAGIITQANEASKTITAVASVVGGIRVTCSAHGYSNGDFVGIYGTTDYNGGWTVSNVATNTFDLIDADLVFTASQTGTVARGDKDLSGLTGLTNVTTSTENSHEARKLYDIHSGTRLTINGALKFNPRYEEITIGGAVVSANFSIYLGATARLIIGKDEIGGTTIAPRTYWTAIKNYKRSVQPWVKTIDGVQGAIFECYGAHFISAGAFTGSGIAFKARDVRITYLQCVGADQQPSTYRGLGPADIDGLECFWADDYTQSFQYPVAIDNYNVNGGLVLAKNIVSGGTPQIDATSTNWPLTGAHHVEFENWNPISGSEFAAAFDGWLQVRNSVVNNTLTGRLAVRGPGYLKDKAGVITAVRDLNFATTDTTGSAITSGKVYTKWENTGVVSDSWNADFSTIREYEDDFDSNGNASFEVLEASCAKDNWVDTGVAQQVLVTPIMHFGDSGIINYLKVAYGYQPFAGSIQSGGVGSLTASDKLLADAGITVVKSNKATVAAYTGITPVYSGGVLTVTITEAQTWNKIYDYLKYWESENPSSVFDNGAPFIAGNTKLASSLNHSVHFINTSTITGPYTIGGGKIQLTATSAFVSTTFDGAEFVFTTAEVYDLRDYKLLNTTLLRNTSGATITVKLPVGTAYSILEGSITVELSAAVVVSNANIIDGSRVQLYNVTKATELDNSEVSGGAGYSFATTLLAGSSLESGDTLRLRAAWHEGTLYKTPYEEVGVISSSGLSFVGFQQVCVAGCALGVDGSLQTEFSADYPNVEVDVNASDNLFRVADLIGWLLYVQTTEQGIRDFFNILTPLTSADWLIKSDAIDLRLDNVNAETATQEDLVIISRTDNVYPQAVPTSGGGGIGLRVKVNVIAQGEPGLTKEEFIKYFLALK